jgi:hypothetical protein
MKKMKGYKFIRSDMTSKNGDISWKKGEWKKHKGKIKLCDSGFHACRTALQSLSYVYGDKWFIVEARGDFEEDERDKFVCSEMRLLKELPIDRVVKLFAIRCAKRSLDNYEKIYPHDKRVRNAIQAAEDYLNGKIDIDNLTAAAWSAAESARSAAESAAWSAAESARSAESAAESAAWSAARSAAWSAESDAAEKKWQEKELEKIIKEVLEE